MTHASHAARGAALQGQRGNTKAQGLEPLGLEATAAITTSSGHSFGLIRVPAPILVRRLPSPRCKHVAEPEALRPRSLPAEGDVALRLSGHLRVASLLQRLPLRGERRTVVNRIGRGGDPFEKCVGGVANFDPGNHG